MTEEPSPAGSQQRGEAPDSEPFVCGVCGRVLDHHEGIGYLHTTGDSFADHDPVPVPQAEALLVAGRCDFCYVDYPEWVVPASDFEVLPGHMSQGPWAACSVCAGLIEKDQWSALVRRAIAGYEERHGGFMPEQAQSNLSPMYRRLRKHITGALQPNPARAAQSGSGRFGRGAKASGRRNETPRTATD